MRGKEPFRCPNCKREEVRIYDELIGYRCAWCGEIDAVRNRKMNEKRKETKMDPKEVSRLLARGFQ